VHRKLVLDVRFALIGVQHVKLELSNCLILGRHDHRPIMLPVACHHRRGFSVSLNSKIKAVVYGTTRTNQAVLRVKKFTHNNFLPFRHHYRIFVMAKRSFTLIFMATMMASHHTDLGLSVAVPGMHLLAVIHLLKPH